MENFKKALLEAMQEGIKTLNLDEKLIKEINEEIGKKIKEVQNDK